MLLNKGVPTVLLLCRTCFMLLPFALQPILEKYNVVDREG